MENFKQGMNDGGNILLMLNESDLEKVLERLLERLFLTYFEKIVTKMNQENNEVFLTENEVQQMLDVTHATLWRWHNNGYLCHTKIGRRCLWRKSEIDKLIRSM